MISSLQTTPRHKWGYAGILLLFLTEMRAVGGYNTDTWRDGANQNGDFSLCRVMREAKRGLLTTFDDQYTASDASCDLTNHCTNANCSAVFSRDRVDAGLVLRICQEDPELLYSVNVPGQWEKPWSHTFTSRNQSGQIQRVEITGNPTGKKPTKWFILVQFILTNGRQQINHYTRYISVNSTLQICQNPSEASCRNMTLFTIPRMPQVQACDYTETHQPPPELGGGIDGGGEYILSSSRSSRNANDWSSPEDLHLRSRNGGNGLDLKPGDKCNSENILECGHGATCYRNQDGSMRCVCMNGYVLNKTSNVCVEKPVTPSDDPTADSINSRSYSSAVGAIMSILILTGIAAGIFFGTKYNYFARIRHRLPVLRCWPFRRAQPWEDNVTMVNPLGPQEDDDPPLL